MQPEEDTTSRHHELLGWSRLKAILLVEAAYIAAIYGTDLDAKRCLILAVFATALVFVLSLMALADQRRARKQTLLLVAIVLINAWNLVVVGDQVYFVIEDALEAPGDVV